jgi:hypothetical protein
MLALFSAPVGQAAARYDFRCPPSSVWQTPFVSLYQRPADRCSNVLLGEGLPEPIHLLHRLLTGVSSFFETRNSTGGITRKASGLLTQQRLQLPLVTPLRRTISGADRGGKKVSDTVLATGRPLYNLHRFTTSAITKVIMPIIARPANAISVSATTIVRP